MVRAGFKVRLIPNYIYQERKRIKKQLEIQKQRKLAMENQASSLPSK